MHRGATLDQLMLGFSTLKQSSILRKKKNGKKDGV
jgi:hypothetical protein